VTPRQIAVALDGDPAPAWQERALASLERSPALTVVEVALGQPRRPGALRRLHARAERHLLGLGADALAPVALERGRAAPSAARADLVVWLSERPPPLERSRDLLYLRHGGRCEPAADAFARAIAEGAGCVVTELLLRRGHETTVLERTTSGVRAFSAAAGRDLMLWKLAATVPRATERAARAEPPPARPPAGRPGPAGRDRDARGRAVRRPRGRGPSTAAPSAAALLAHAARTWPRVLGVRLLYRRQWSLRVRERRAAPTERWGAGRELVRLRPGHLYADPFLFELRGRHHLFCEEVALGGRRGVISHTELRGDGGRAEPPQAVLSEPHHLSYPFVFEHEGQVLMIPESSAARRVDLYRAADFPRRWRHEAVLLDGVDASDATILATDDRLWMFVSIAAPDASSLDELHLFWAPEPRGPWRAHRSNPVVSDARRARPAGAIQRWGPRLVRPGQDGSRRYGGAISFCQIDVLDESAYAEHEIARLDPADVAGARATHTYSCDARFEAIDLRRRELRVRSRLQRLS
jgi:hypothetical protein